MSVIMETHNYRITSDERCKIFIAQDECVSVELPPTHVNSEPITIYNKTEANKVIVYHMSDEGIKTDVAELNINTSLIFYPNILDSSWETNDRIDVPYSRIIGAALNCSEMAQYIPLRTPVPSTMLVLVRVFRDESFSDVSHVIRTPNITNCVVDCLAGPFSIDNHAIVSFYIEDGNVLVAYPMFIGLISQISICVYA